MLLAGGAVHFFQWELLRMLTVVPDSHRQLGKWDTPPDILILGDSLLAQSLPGHNDQPDLFGEGYTWAKFGLPWGRYNDFTAISSDQTRRFKIIVINQGVLTGDNIWDQPEKSIKSILRLAIHYGRRQLGKLVKTSARATQQAGPVERPESDGPGPVETTNQNCKLQNARQISRKADALNWRYRYGTVLSGEALAFLRSLNASADVVVVLRLPRAISLEKLVSDNLENYQRALSSVLSEQNIPLIELGSVMPDDHYCDGSHPNELGQTIRTRQLVDLVKEWLPSTQ